ncbi:MAG: 3-isopropylmalate dehydratase small subunit [Azospirillaceae bacterium]|nr:3-isopropylmalate dehydratase small subunit [Azospirillaceae bacterium]
MEPFVTLTGVAAPLQRQNIDTDAIIPSREMKTVGKTGLSGGLFANWRYADVAARTENPDFILNRAPFRQATILLAGSNFGCGSSREHAVWALKEWGVRCIVAPSFGAIFHGNCVRNGILPVTLPADAVAALATAAGQATSDDPAPARLTVDLRQGLLTGPHLGSDPGTYPFTLSPADRDMLLEGLDAIGLTLKRLPAIQSFEADYRAATPWALPVPTL